MKTILPQAFIDKYRELLGEEADAFFASFDQPARSAFRINPLKKQKIDFPNPIPNTEWGYYGKISGKSPEHVTGLIYSQEPAAQMVGQVAKPEPGMRVLDLSAAPGGKSTHLLSYLGNQGILVSNDISKKRSQVLVENIERFGARNVVVLNESADRLAKVFPNYFDLIVFDGPCSGEGMFRKDPEAIQYWTVDYPSQCADLQQSILQDALTMLAPGGRLVYSTCTWAPEENEGVVSWLLQEYPELTLLDVPKLNGMVEGIDLPQTARIYPHQFEGEGQFVAHFQDQGLPASIRIKSGHSNLTKGQKAYWQEFAKEHLRVDLSGMLQVFGDQLYLLPQELPDLSSLKIARNGLHLGTFKKNRFEPSFALGMALSSDEVKRTVTISEADFSKYVSGQTVTLQEALSTGWYQLLVGGNGLGFVKVVGQVIKNYYPKGLRFQV
ncbi:RsmF rRNA methyltransferase first C-terminal domain-containing protein [Streptococcus sp. sy004]|uniref:RsmF rRNA methyltransferase first C-terminal domain-containing protein n=1 Tax=Streptococcus sp. sy004 TaxID=2600149 RepID=UPI0011B5B8A5|nr:RsmB/NOP family class I SAM-dependent RNA methyltransferase [Streptococcus sp. sy004]TWT12393.1 methyltransferase domain-containing protein [Streptococcus sp. sy004]